MSAVSILTIVIALRQKLPICYIDMQTSSKV
uniref:Uncharacterized protein n=1 Tax=Arundo donax TaxID=35708 RepID=A0A0A8Y1B1_ARUDO